MESRTSSASQFVSFGPFGIATPSAQEAVLIANTPSFLLDRLRKDIAVQYVADNMKPAEILDALQKGVLCEARDAKSLVPLYVFLVALSTVDPRDTETWSRINALDLSKLEWGEVIRRLMRFDAVPVAKVDVTLTAVPKP